MDKHLQGAHILSILCSQHKDTFSVFASKQLISASISAEFLNHVDVFCTFFSYLKWRESDSLLDHLIGTIKGQSGSGLVFSSHEL